MLLQSALPPGSPPGIGVSPPTTAEITPASETQDLGVLDCRVTGDDGRTFGLMIRDGGERGYRDPRNGEVLITEAEIDVESTPAGLFGKYRVNSAMHGGESGYKGWATSPDAAFGRNVDFKLSRVTPPMQRTNERYALVMDGYWGWLPLTRAVGFCDLQRTRQQPLSEAETRKYLKL